MRSNSKPVKVESTRAEVVTTCLMWMLAWVIAAMILFRIASLLIASKS